MSVKFLLFPNTYKVELFLRICIMCGDFSYLFQCSVYISIVNLTNLVSVDLTGNVKHDGRDNNMHARPMDGVD